MKSNNSKNYLEKILFFFIIINLLKIINQKDIEVVDTNLDFIHALSLKNGNIFLLHKNGIIVYNYNMTIILYNYEHSFISSESENNLTTIIQCEDNNQYVIALIKNNLHVFTSRGQFLFTISNNLLDDLSREIIYISYSFLYYKHDNTKYYFIITYINIDKNIKIIEFTIDLNAKTYNEYKTKTHFIENILSDSASSQIVNTDGFNNILAIFSIKNIYENCHNNYFVLSLFDIENNITMINETKIGSPVGYKAQDNYLIKSAINKDKDKIFINFANSISNSIRWFGFYFNLFKISNIANGATCDNNIKLININYFSFIDNFIFSCLSRNGIGLNKLKNYSNKDNIEYIPIEDGTIQNNSFNNCSNFKNFYIIFLIYESKYKLITNFLCYSTFTQIYNFPSYIDASPSDYIKPSDFPDSNMIPSITIPKFIPTTIATIIHTTLSTTISIIVPTTIPTTIETTILSIISTNFQTTISITILTAISTTIPTTISINIQSTNPTILTTILTTISIENPRIPTAILTTNPTTILTNIPTIITTQISDTNQSTIPTNIITIISSIILTTIPFTIPITFPKIISTKVSQEYETTTRVIIPTTVPKTIPEIILSNITNPSENVEITFTYIDSTFISKISEQIIEDIISEIIYIEKEDIMSQIYSVVEDIKLDQIYKKIGQDYNILIYPTNSSVLTSVTHANFSECENILRNHYHIPSSSILTFLQIEIENSNSKSLINQVEYQAYDGNNKTFLNLSLCEDANIEIFYSIKNKSLEDFFDDFSLAKNFEKSGIDIFNINDSFFNDICYPYSESDNDLILEDRIEDINFL